MSTLKQRIEQYLGGSTPKVFGDRSEAIADEYRRLKEKIDQQTVQQSLDRLKKLSHQ